MSTAPSAEPPSISNGSKGAGGDAREVASGELAGIEARLLEIGPGPGLVPRHAVSLVIHHGQGGEGTQQALLGRLLEPVGRQLAVLLHALALQVHESEAMLGQGVVLLR